MEREDVNRRITAAVDEIEDEQVRQFIQDALAFERSKMDRSQPHFKKDYRRLLKEYSPTDSEPDTDE